MKITKNTIDIWENIPKNGYFGEQYLVKFNNQKEDGYWIYGIVANVSVCCGHGINEKNNHQKAENLVKEKFPNCQIVSVVYC